MPKRGRKTGRKLSPGSQSTPSERVVWLLETVWEGNRSEMARAVGCSHVVLSKIANGHQEVGRQLLSAIASHSKVSPAWLLGGEGEPLLAESEATPSEGWPLPIAKQLLPGGPRRQSALAIGGVLSHCGCVLPTHPLLAGDSAGRPHCERAIPENWLGGPPLDGDRPHMA